MRARKSVSYTHLVADFVLVMTVNPGFAGQVIVEETLRKIENVRSYLDERGYRDTVIQVDGNVSFENARKMKAAGAGNFVAGSAGLFRTDMTIPEACLLYTSMGRQRSTVDAVF